MGLFSLSIGVANASTLYWDGTHVGGNGDGVSDGGAATWDAASANWDQGSGIARIAWPNASDSIANFAGSAGTVTLGAAITANGLIFNTANYNVTGSGTNTLTFAGTTPTIATNANATISAAIVGSASLTKSGSGTLSLNNNSSSFTGNLDIQQGKVTSGYGYTGTTSAFGDLATAGRLITVESGAILEFTGNSVLGGTLPKTVLNGGTVQLVTGSRTPIGAIDLNGGTILSGDGSIRTEQGNNGGTITQVSSALQLTGDVNVTGNSLIAPWSGNGGLGLYGMRTFNVATAANLSVTARLGGAWDQTAGIIKTGDGTMTLSMDNIYQLPTTISGGTLAINNSLALQNSTVILNAGDTGVLAINVPTVTLGGLTGSRDLDFGSATTVSIGNNNSTNVYHGNLTGMGGLTLIGSGELDLSGTNLYQGPTVISSGIVRLQSTGALPAGTKIMCVGDSITAGVGGTQNGYRGYLYHDLNAAASDGFQLVGTSHGNANNGVLPASPIDETGHDGFGSWTSSDVSGAYAAYPVGPNTANTGQGNISTWLNSLAAVSQTPTHICLMIGMNDAFNNDGTDTVCINNVTTIINTAFTQDPNVRFLVGTVNPIFGEGQTPQNSFPVQNAYINTLNADLATLVANYQGQGKNIALVDMATNFPSAGHTNDAVHPNDLGYAWMASQWTRAILSPSFVSSTAAIPPNSPVTVASGATLDLGGNSAAIPSLSGSGSVTLGNGALGACALTVNSATGNDSTFGGVISGAGGLTKNGSASLSLSNANTYTGATTINAGNLVLGAGGSIATTSSLSVAAGTMLDATAKANYALSPAVAIGLNGTAGTSGRINVSGGNLNLAGANVNFTVTGTLNAPAYVIGNYSVLSGTATFNNLPAGYVVSYAYNNGTQIALVPTGTVTYPVPTITTLSPTTGVPGGGTTVTITGTNLYNTTSVTFGGTAATAVTVVDSNTVTCVTPAHVAATVDVVLINPGGNVTQSASFTYSPVIMASAGTGGTISPSGAALIAYGATQSFTITPNSGFVVSDVIVDGTSVGTVATYTFTNVTANHTIAATFSQPTITATASTGGTISPSGTLPIAYGTNQTFTFTPDSGYQIAGVQVDGVSVGAVTTYTFSNVTANHTIAALFSIPGSLGTGGAVTVSNGYIYHTFTGNGTYTPTATGMIEVLVVAGGGGGGTVVAGGGGAGGLIYGSSYSVTNGTPLTVVVGAGGAGSPNGGSWGPGTKGSDSVFGSLTAIGGGGGGGYSSQTPSSGGSGGGFGRGTGAGAVGTAGQGNAGGAANSNYAGGGGGAGSAGQAGIGGSTNKNGDGGAGLQLTQFAAVGGSPAGWFASGGAATGTSGFGADGASSNGGGGSLATGLDGVANTGGGGAGGRWSPQSAGGNGGSGIVIVRYLAASSYSISGTVTMGGSGLSGVTVSDGTRSAITANDGSYTIINVPDATTYTVTPTLAGYTFTPASTSVTLSGASVSGKDFSVATQSYTAWSSGGQSFSALNRQGINYGLAWILGASSPSADSMGLMPKPSQVAGDLMMQFTCLKPAGMGTATLSVQYGTDLSSAMSWSGVSVPDVAVGWQTGPQVDFLVVTDPTHPNLNDVMTRIHAGAVGGKLFGRLQATGN